MSNVKISNFTTVSGTPADVNNLTAIAGVEGSANAKISGAQLITSLESNMVLSNISGTLSIAKGGTGNVTAQAAIDALTGVSSANTNQVLTKDSNGNATFQSLPSGAGVMTTTTLGTAKLFYPATQGNAPAANASNVAGRSYGIQLNSSNQLVVNVPWEDTEGPVADVKVISPGTSTGTPLKYSPQAGTGNVELQSMAYDGGVKVGHVPSGGSSSNFLRGDGQWATPANTVYTAGAGIEISQSNVISNSDGGSEQFIYKTITGTSGTTTASSNNDTLNITGSDGIKTTVTTDTVTVAPVAPTTYATLTGATPSWNINNNYNAKYTIPSGGGQLDITAADGSYGTLLVDASTSADLSYPTTAKFEGGTEPTLEGTCLLSVLVEGTNGATAIYFAVGLNFS